MSKNAISVANYIIEEYKDKQINNLHLQKLLYYLQANYMIENDGELLFTDDMEKWKLGPVVPNVYHSFKEYGPSPITDAYTEFEISFNAIKGTISFVEKEDSIEDCTKEFIDKIMQYLLKYDKFELVQLTHEHPMWKEDESLIINGVKNIKYRYEDMREYFINHPEDLLVN